MDTNNGLIKFNKNDDPEKIKKTLEDMLKKDPKNIDLLLRLAKLEMDSPFHDEYKSIEYLEKIFKIEKDHPIALLVLADIQVRRMGNIDEEMMKKLSSLTTSSPEINSMFRFAAAWFYGGKDINMQEKLLEESVSFFKGHVLNHLALANLYLKKGQKEKAKECIKKALSNVRKVYKIEDWIHDPSDVNELLYEFFNGIELTTSQYESLKKRAEEINNS